MAVVLPLVSSAAPPPAAPPRADPAPGRRRIGELLVRQGALSRPALDAALARQAGQDERLGRILLADQLITEADLGSALAEQSGLGEIDLAATPPDPGLLAGLDPYRCLALEALPWREVAGTRVIALASPDRAGAAAAACGAGARHLAFALARPEAIRAALAAAFAGRLRDDARERCPEALSCRGWTRRARPGRAAPAVLAALALAALAPLASLQLLLAWVLLANGATMALRLVALAARLRRGRPAAPPPAVPRLADRRKLPRVSLLVPLRDEAAVAGPLIDALAAMDYPPALLDIKLVLEADDTVTRAALEAASLPPTIEIVLVPPDGLRTKPRAMNFALPFCRGDIVGVYDAEDRPDPGQIRAVVAHLQAAPPEVACVQGYLDFYNERDSWLARCFTLEYAIWFRVVLLGVERLGLPIPLGGTSVFFRRPLLETLGGWDAHNVTEDADLGMRLARFGYRCEMIASTTREEASCRVRPWIRQRSRWLKGYLVTWVTHMRTPRALWRDLGPAGFLGFQVLFLGALTSYLALPLVWGLVLARVLLGADLWSTLPPLLAAAGIASMLAGQAVMLTTAVVAARDSGRPGLVPWTLVLPVYWLLGAVAAWRALGEVFTRPSFWHKTAHGLRPVR